MEARPASPVSVQERSTGGKVNWSGRTPRASMSRNVQSACAGRPERASDARRELKEASVVAGAGGIRHPARLAIARWVLASSNAPGTAVSPAAGQGGGGSYALATKKKWAWTVRLSSWAGTGSVESLAV